MFIPDTNYSGANKIIHDNQEDMEEIFLQALVTRSQVEAGLIDQLPEDVKVLVEEKLSTEIQNLETINEAEI